VNQCNIDEIAVTAASGKLGAAIVEAAIELVGPTNVVGPNAGESGRTRRRGARWRLR